MENKLNKKFGIITAISMVIGIVIGSGAFFKAQDVLSYTNGNLLQGIFAWICSGLVMLFCAIPFSKMATKEENCSGIMDYAQAHCGTTYSYYVGWFMATIYCPTMTSFLAIASSRFICSLLGFSTNGGEALAIAGTLLVLSFSLNSLAPKLAGKFQVTTTIIKIIPLIIMGIVGTIYGLSSGLTVENFTNSIQISLGNNSIFKAIVATSFAYEGWIVATSINSELKGSKKDLPKALFWGSIIIIFIYIFYFIGLYGSNNISSLITYGPVSAFKNLFGNIAGTILNVFALMCCLGSLNGLTVGSVRAMYSISLRERGGHQKLYSQVDKISNMPTNSALTGLLLSSIWMLYYYGAKMTTTPWFGLFSFDSCDLPVITIYALYIPVFMSWGYKRATKQSASRKIYSILAILSCIFMIFCAVMGHGVFEFMEAKKKGEFSFPVLFYLIIFAIIMYIGFILDFTNRPINLSNFSNFKRYTKYKTLTIFSPFIIKRENKFMYQFYKLSINKKANKYTK